MSSLATPRYTAADITVLEGLEPVRKRPSMYIGGVDSQGLHHLVWEIVDNAVDEYLNGHADAITVTLHKSGDAVTVSDNGRGIPVDIHPKHKRPGARADPDDAALRRQVRRGRQLHSLRRLARRRLVGRQRPVARSSSPPSAATASSGSRRFRRGKPASELKQVGPFRGHGTTIYFEPDPDIFKTTQFDAELITQSSGGHVVHPQRLKITFKNEITKETFDLTHPGGIPEFLDRLVAEGQKPPVTEVAVSSWPAATARRWKSPCNGPRRPTRPSARYVNGIRTSSGGTHENGFKSRHRQGDPQLHGDARHQDQGTRASRPRISARGSSASCRCSCASRCSRARRRSD